MNTKEEIDQVRKGLMEYDDYSLVVMGIADIFCNFVNELQNICGLI